MSRKVDDLSFKALNLGLLGFLIYGGIVYAPDSIATLILGFIGFIVFVWFVFDILVKIGSNRTNKAMNRYYR